jgi:type I restriction enzyme S subunit
MNAAGTNWREVKLGSILRYLDERVEMDDEKEYLTITVKRRHGGLEIREKLFGHQIATKKQFRLVPGAFIISRVQCWHQAYAIVPNVPPNTIASTNYDQFEISSQVDPRFFWWLSHSPEFTETVRSSAVGVVIEKMVFDREDWLTKSVRLPSLAEQQRVVARIEELAAQIHEARTLRHQAAEEAEALLASSSLAIFSELHSRVGVGSICEVIDPNPSHRYPAYVDEGVPIISSSEFTGEDGIDPRSAKRVPDTFYKSTLGRYGVGEGDVIFSRKGKVGYARLHPDKVKLAMTHTLCVLKPNRSKVDSRYLLHFARSPVFLEELTGTMNPNVGVPTLGLGVIRDASIPVPPVAEQRRIVAELDALQAEVDALKRIQAETAVELDALMPSVLDKAFRGEL